jgi:anti-sigma factor RsiW
MSCPELLRTQAYLDGELEGASASEAERHIEGCAECQAFSADAASLSDAMWRQIPRYRAPEGLRRRIAAALDRETDKPRILAFGAPRRSFWAGAAGGAGVSALAAAFAFLLILPPSSGTLEQAVADAHTRALVNGHTIEVVSSNHHTVKPWFAGRVPLSPPVADFAKDGFTLTGGRVDNVAGSRAAVVVYRHGNHEIDLFVWADNGSRLPADATTHGYHTVFWKKSDLDFAAVSDMDSGELHKFVDLVRSEPE